MGSARLTTPVAFFIFNRPDTTERVFEAIRQARPQQLLVVADGPRPHRPADAAGCKAARAIIERVDWDCDVKTNYSELNLGCKRRIASGLAWVFQQAEEAIILEDDCLPAPSFFTYCQALLEKYRHDDRILLIGGANLLGKDSRQTDSYYFSKYPLIWGWASWRRAFAHYDVDMKTWPEFRRSGRLREFCENRGEYRYWTARFDQAHSGAIDTWDYQMVYTCWSNGLLAITPEKNLVSNIGFSATATHIALDDDALSNLPVSDISEIVHPPRVERDPGADRYLFHHIYQGRWRRVRQHLERGYSENGVVGLAMSMIDLAQRAARLMRAH